MEIMSAEGISVVADDDFPRDLAARFANFVATDPYETRRFLGQPHDARLHFRLSSGGGGVETQPSADGVRMVVPAEVAEFILARAEVRQWSAGQLVVPTLYHLQTGGVFDAIGSGALIGDLMRRVVPDDPVRNEGYVLGALRMCALHGWIEIEGTGSESTVRRTPRGDVMIELLASIEERLRQSVDAVSRTKEYYRHARKTELPTELLTEFRSLVSHSKDRWGIAEQDPGTRARVARQLLVLLDGAILGPTLVALAMPTMEREGRATRITYPSVVELFDRPDGTLNRDRLAGHYNEAFVESGLSLLAHHGLAEAVEAGWTLTDRGRLVLSLVGHVGVAAAYLRLYEVLDEVLFRNPDPLDRASDGHCDRLINIWGTSGISTRVGRQVARTLLRETFDETPLDRQPAGVADMGCGDGLALKTFVEYIVNETERGRHLEEYPLVVVGADYYEEPLRRTRATLAAFSDNPNIHTAVVRADVGDPEGYDRSIQALEIPRPGGGGVVRARDLVHSMFYLSHDRELRVRTVEEAEEVLRAAIRETDSAQLKSAVEFASHGKVEWPAGEEQRFNTVRSQFTVSYALQGRLVPPIVAAADFIRFLERWRPHTVQGLILVEMHVPRHDELQNDEPPFPEAWSRSDRYGLHIWGFHYLTDQYPLPFCEHYLATTLGGLKPINKNIDGDSLYFTGDLQRSVMLFRPASA